MDGVQAALLRAQELARAGRLQDAIGALQQGTGQFPDDPRLPRALALLHMQAGDSAAALGWMRQAHQLAPDAAELAEQYGSLLAYAGLFHEALAPLQRAAALQPAKASAWYLLGLALLRSTQALEALTPLRRAQSLDPGDPRIRAALAEAEFAAGFPEDALPLLRAQHQADPAHLDTLLKLGETLSRLDEHQDALAHYTAALAAGAPPADLHMALAQAREDVGDRDGAARSYAEALRHRPDWAFPIAGLLGVLRDKAGDDLLDAARRQLADPGTTDQDRALLGYALGKVDDARGRHPEALASWVVANDARRKMVGAHDEARLEALRDRIIAASSGDMPHDAIPRDDDGGRPVFIVGMPRSGTTLTEQILASHPRAHGCGELPHVSLLARHLPRMAGSSLGWPELTRQAQPDVVLAARARYLARARRHAPADALRLVDKAPLNFFQLDLVARMFPEARVVWCRRDPRDVAVSIYAENFSLEESFATDMRAIGHFISVQHALMQHWLATSPLPIHTLDYERLVTDLEGEARKLVEFVGLPWDDACLAFHSNDRGVQTPSRWQVKQPAHTRSIGRWRNYADAIQPLLERLPAGILP